MSLLHEVPIFQRMKSVALLILFSTLGSVSVTVKEVVGGEKVIVKVVLTSPAPAEGLVVKVGSDSAAGSVPSGSTVTVPAQQSGQTFVVTTRPVTSVTPVTITAEAANVQRSVSFLIVPPALTSFSLGATSVTGGTSVTGRVTLTGSAPKGGMTIPLASSVVAASLSLDGGASKSSLTTVPLTLPQAVMIAEGQSAQSPGVTTGSGPKGLVVRLRVASGAEAGPVFEYTISEP